MERRLIFLSWAFPPMQYPRAFQVGRLVRTLDEKVAIDLVCADEAGGGTSIDTALKQAKVHRRRPPIWELLHRIVSKLSVGRLAHIPDEQMFWSLSAANYVSKELAPEPQNVLVTFGQPMSVHIAGLILKRRHGLKWVAHFSDPWVENPFLKRGKIIQSLNRILEKRVLSYCDRAIFTSQETIDLVFQNYPKYLREKASILPHSYDPVKFPSHPSNRYRDQGDKSEKQHRSIVIRSIGNFYGARSPRPFILALEHLLKADPLALDNVKIEFVGNIDNWPEGEFDSRLDKVIQCTGYVSPEKASELTLESDLLLLIDSKADVSVFLPSKLIDYIAASRPILAITPIGTAEKLVKRYGGWVSDPSRVHETAETLKEVISYIREFGSNKFGHNAVREEFSIDVVSDKFLFLLNSDLSP